MHAMLAGLAGHSGRTAAAFALALAATTAALAAQEPPPPTYVPWSLDSGLVDARADGAPVHVGDVHYPGTSSMQLWFSVRTLQPGTRLRLQSMHDGAVQWFDQYSLSDYGNVSAFFNGDTVRIELWPAAGSIGNRIAVSKLRIGDVITPTEGVCQATDIRVPSSDPRTGRLDGCCTAFLVDERTLCSAGHCIASIGGQLVHFNVPLSDAGGNAQYPPPQDQYALRAGSLTAVNGGLGNDYAVLSTVRNSNTGLYPGQAQGSWFTPALVPPGSQGMVWTVVGYGTSGVNTTWSLAQKSASGPRASTSNSLLQFRITVTGCNSGSPVIGTNGTDVHGVVTHAGCTATGGANYGTGLGLAAYLQALQGVQQAFVAGTLGVFGQGCPGASGTPQLAFSGAPDLGGSVTATVTNTDAAVDSIGVLSLGVSNTSWNGTPLPIDLGLVGLPGCSLHIAPELDFALSTNFGGASLVLAIPNQPPFLGTSFYGQYFALDATAVNGGGIVTTNGARMRIGN
jgi:hypothetical protein